MRKMTPQERIEKFAVPIPFCGCWLWTGHVDDDEYGKIDKTVAHRYVYQHLVGEIRQGMTLDHTCEVRCCVNPAHMEQVTAGENSRRSYDRGRHFLKNMTHCANGHPFSGDNLYVNPNNLKRICKTCRREYGRKHDAKRRPRCP